MKKIENIREEFGELKSFSPGMLHSLYEYFGDIKIEDYKYVDIVFIDESPISILISCLTREEINRPKELQIYLQETDHRNYYDLLYLVTLYLWFDSDPDMFKKNPFLLPKNVPADLLDQCFAITHGMIIYPFQVEQFYMAATKSIKAKAMEISHGIRVKSHETWRHLEGIIFDDNRTLKERIKERMISEFLFNPQFKQAKILFDYLNK